MIPYLFQSGSVKKRNGLVLLNWKRLPYPTNDFINNLATIWKTGANSQQITFFNNSLSFSNLTRIV